MIYKNIKCKNPLRFKFKSNFSINFIDFKNILIKYTLKNN